MSEPADVPEDLLREVCRRHGIAHDDRFLVLDRLRKGGAAAACCGSDCRPCVLDVEAAEQELRAMLERRQDGD